MNKSILLFLFITLMFNALFAQDKKDEELIKNVIQEAYIDGLCNNADEDAIRKGFHLDFNLMGARKDNTIWKLPINRWIEIAKTGKEKGYKYSFQNDYTTVKFLSIDIASKVAVAKIEFYEGDEMNYIDYLSLMKFEDGWKIVSKIFHPIPKEEKKEEHHTIIEDYTQLTGDQILDEKSNIKIPYSKQGYTLHLPNSNPVATIIMLSGSALDTSRQIDEFALIKPALEKNMAVLFVSTGKVIEFLFTDDDIHTIDELVGKALKKHKLSDKPKFLVGMSLGGTMALRYSEYSLLNKSKIGFNADAIAICDAPLDMVRMWHEQQQAIKNNYHPNAVGEARWVSHFLKKHLGGSPDESMKAYINYSPFVYKDEERSKIGLFKNTPIRMYHEPDIDWWIENRAKDYNTFNSIDLAGFYNYLRQAGNKQAELITTHHKRKGYAKGSSPHSWTIVDNEELVDWFLSKIK